MSLIWELQEIEKRAALERVLASSAFQRSDEIKVLLRFVCEREIEGLGEGLNEFTVAIDGLGRPPNYSPVEDGTVRNRVHNLRRRLDQYYEVEHPEDPVRIVLPKDGYCPVFMRSPGAAPARPKDGSLPRRQMEIVESPAVLPGFRGWLHPARSLLICGLLFAFAAGLAVGVKKPSDGLDPVLIAAWGPLLENNSSPLVCVSAPRQLLAIAKPGDSPSAAAMNSAELAWYENSPFPSATEIHVGPNLATPFWGDVAGALGVVQLMGRAGLVPEVLPESAVSVSALDQRNAVLFGRPGFSKAIDVYLRDTPFRIRISSSHGVPVIWNVHPRPGESAEYPSEPGSRDTGWEIAFGLITVLASRSDPNRRTVVFSGNLSAGTQAASTFFSSPERLRSLLRQFRQEGRAGFPNAYQVVVRSKLSSVSTRDLQYVTHRIVSK